MPCNKLTSIGFIVGLEADVVKDREQHESALMRVSCIHDPHCITDLDPDSAAKTHYANINNFFSLFLILKL